MDWEQWLRTAAKPPSDTEDGKRELTEDQIREALKNYGPLQGRPYRVYAKGSYANNTNVRLNYDVDIAVEYHGFFYADLCLALKDEPQSTVGVVDTDDPYTRDEFKADIENALISAFGNSAVKPGNIAYRVREKKTTLPADVVPCWELRRYDGKRNDGSLIVHYGSRVFPTGGFRKDNFPKKQLDRGKAKNVDTGGRYKRMVRAFKKLQTYLVSQGILEEELASYFSECLVYNVKSTSFGHSNYLDDMRAVLAHIFNETLPSGSYESWEHVHGLQYLFHGEFSRSKAHTVADKCWDALGFS